MKNFRHVHRQHRLPYVVILGSADEACIAGNHDRQVGILGTFIVALDIVVSNNLSCD